MITKFNFSTLKRPENIAKFNNFLNSRNGNANKCIFYGRVILKTVNFNCLCTNLDFHTCQTLSNANRLTEIKKINHSVKSLIKLWTKMLNIKANSRYSIKSTSPLSHFRKRVTQKYQGPKDST